MADKISRDRSMDDSIDTDLDLGELDDIFLDAPGDPNAGIEKGKGRRPSHSTKKTASDFIKGAVGGVAKGAKTAIYSNIPEVGMLAHEASDTLDDIQALKDDLSKQLTPIGTSVENAARKLLPKVEKFVPKSAYQRIKKKLEERHANRVSLSGSQKSQETIDQETIRNELAAIFDANAQMNLETARTTEKNVMMDRALGSIRHQQTTMQIVNLYDSVRSTELFHKTQHLAYMKKSLELKYKHLFIARDTFNVLRKSLNMHEGYLKAIVDNTALPDMMKQKSTDFIAGGRTKAYGELMSSAMGNLRGKIFDQLKKAKETFTTSLSAIASGADMYADFADMDEMMGTTSDKSTSRTVGKMAGMAGGFLGIDQFLNKHRGAAMAINDRIAGARTAAANKLTDLRQSWYNRGGVFELLSGFIPDPFRQQTAASNDLISDPSKAVAFDVMTRQSITEIIPGYLGKIWHEIAMMRTGDETVEEKAFNVFERKFTGVSDIRRSIDEQSFGTQAARRDVLLATLGKLQVGVARNRPSEDPKDLFKGYEKSINQVFVNHAVFSKPFSPDKLQAFLMNNVMTPYIDTITKGIDQDPKDVIERICSAMYDDEGKLDASVYNSIVSSIDQGYRRKDAHKQVLAAARETYGYSDVMSSSMSGDVAKRLSTLASMNIKDGSDTESAEDKVKREKLNAAILDARKRMSTDSYLTTGYRGSTINLDAIASKRGDVGGGDFDIGEFNEASRRTTYEGMANYDKAIRSIVGKADASKILGKLGISGSKIAEKLGYNAKRAEHIATDSYDKMFNVAASAAEGAKSYGESIKNRFASAFGLDNKPKSKPQEVDLTGLDTSTSTPSTPRPTATRFVPPTSVAATPAVSLERAPTVEAPTISGDSANYLKDILDHLVGWKSAQSEEMGLIFDHLVEWKSDQSQENGTIFDAIAQVDETLRSGVIAGGGAPAAGGGAPKRRGWRGALGAAGRGIGAGIKNVGKAYTRIYGAALKGAGEALKGAGNLASTLVGKGADLAQKIGKWATHKEDYVDIYVKGKEGGMPLVSARKQKDPDEGIFFKSSGKRVMKSSDIDQPCVDKSGNLVITEEDLKAGLVMNNSTPIGKIGAGLLSVGKGYFSVYGKALEAIGGVAKTVVKAVLGSGVERYVDIYRKDEIYKGPLVTARVQKDNGVYFFESGKRVDRSSDIHEPICDADKKVVISKEDIEHGLVDVNNKPLGSSSGGLLGLALPAIKGLGGVLGAGAKSAAGIYGTAYKGILDLGIKGLKGAGKFLSRALGLDLSKSGIGGTSEEVSTAITGSYAVLQKIAGDVAILAEPHKNKAKNPLDADGDGDIDGSYADQMSKKKKASGDKLDARDLHKDVNWLKPEDEDGEGEGGEDGEGGSIFDWMPDSWKRKGRRWKRKGRVLGRKAARGARGMASKVGRGLMRGGRGLLGKVGGLGGRALGAGARFLPALGGLFGSGSAAAAGGAAAAGAGGAAAGAGAAGAAGALGTVGAALGPAALAALAGYGIYRGVKGFSKENTLANLGEGLDKSKENQLTFEDRMASALGMNTKIGGTIAKGLMSISPVVGLLKGIRGNDNPLTDKEIEQGRAKLQRRIDKGMPGYDRVLQEYEKAVTAGNWSRARQLSGKEADGIIASLWKNSITGKVLGGTWSLLFGNDNKEMSKEEIDKVRNKYNSIIQRGGPSAKNAERILDKFDDYVAEGDWKRARKLAGEQFQSKGFVGSVFSGIKSFFVADKDKPMSGKEIQDVRNRLQGLIDGGNKSAQKILDQFDEAVTEMNWKKARKLGNKETMSGLNALGKGLKTTAKWTARILTLGASTLLESSQDDPMDPNEIRKFTDKMNYLIEKKNDKAARRKLEKFEDCVAREKWAQARKIAKAPHVPMIAKAIKATWTYLAGSDDKEMSEQEMTKFRESMNRKINIGGSVGKNAQRKLDAFEDAVGTQNWRKARLIAGTPDSGVIGSAAKSIGKGLAKGWRFMFGGDGQPMSDNEIEQARKEFGWAIQDGKKGAQKRLDMFEDYVADEKWEKARQLAKMPYKNVLKRAGAALGGWLFGNDKDAMTPEEIDKTRGELEQRVADAPEGRKAKPNKILEAFNNAVMSENWAKARKVAGIKAEGVFQKAKAFVNPLNWFKDDYEDCAELRDEIDEKIIDEGDETGLLNKGLDMFDTLVRRQKYEDAVKLGKDMLKLKPHELAAKHSLNTEEYEKLSATANDLMKKIDKARDETSGWSSPIKKMKLGMLASSVKNDTDRWGEEFFNEASTKLGEIMDSADYIPDHQRPDDDRIFERGKELLKTIDEVDDNRSWIGSPVIKSRLGNLRSEVKSDPTLWDDDQINRWYDKLGEIDEDYTGGRKGMTEEDAAIEKRGDDLVKSIKDAMHADGQGMINMFKLGNLLNVVQSNRSEWDEGTLTTWEEKFREITGAPDPASENAGADGLDASAAGEAAPAFDMSQFEEEEEEHGPVRSTVNKLPASEFKEFENQFASGGFVNTLGNLFSGDGMRTDRAVVRAVCNHIDKVGPEKYDEAGDLGDFLSKYPMDPKDIPAGADDNINGDTAEAIDEEFARRHPDLITKRIERNYTLGENETTDPALLEKWKQEALERSKKTGVARFFDRMMSRHAVRNYEIDRPTEYASGGFLTDEHKFRDQHGNLGVAGEAGPEAIIPLNNRPGNLLDRLGNKLRSLMRGQDIGPAGVDASLGMATAGSQEAEPLINYLAKKLADVAGISARGTSFSSTLSDIGKSAQATAAAQTADLIKDKSPGSWIDRAISGTKKVVSGISKSVSEWFGNEPEKPETVAAKPAPTPATTPDATAQASAELTKTSLSMVDEIKALNKSTADLYKLISLVLTKEGVKVQGIEELAQVVAQTGSISGSEGGPTTTQIIQVAPQETGIDLRKKAS